VKPTLLTALIAALALALALGLAACGGGDDDAGVPSITAQRPNARPAIGIGEQQAAMFKDERFTDLGIKNVRLVTAYDTASVGFERDLMTVWLDGVRRTRSEPFVTFGHSRVNPKRLPSVAEYRAAFRAFRKRFPEVLVFAPWNEINHSAEPTSRSPRRAAQYYNVMTQECPECTVLAGDVLDQPGMVRYLRRYQRYIEGKPEIWGLHNYSDTNRFRTTGLRDMLANVEGEVWLTETGGIVKFGRNFPRDERRAARAVAYAIEQARDTKRVTRLYLYNWTGADPKARFDSGLIAADGSSRPAYEVLRKAVGG
jgi:hypothetical protein